MDPKVYLKDNRGLPEIASDSIDVVMADPPFGIDFGKSNYNRTPDEVSGYVEIDKNYSEFLCRNFEELKRVIKLRGLIFWWCACVTKDRKEDRLLTVLQAAKEVGLIRHRDIIWGYQFGVYTPSNFTISHQHVLVLSKFEWFDWYGHYEEDAVYLKRRYKRDQKTNVTETNEELVEWLMSVSTKDGDTVLDPFYGSGTTGVVGQRLHRNVIGYEINAALESRILERLPHTHIVK